VMRVRSSSAVVESESTRTIMSARNWRRSSTAQCTRLTTMGKMDAFRKACWHPDPNFKSRVIPGSSLAPSHHLPAKTRRSSEGSAGTNRLLRWRPRGTLTVLALVLHVPISFVHLDLRWLVLTCALFRRSHSFCLGSLRLAEVVVVLPTHYPFVSFGVRQNVKRSAVVCHTTVDVHWTCRCTDHSHRSSIARALAVPPLRR
jgi:hypothetical protein